jgi:hypothetical protein
MLFAALCGSHVWNSVIPLAPPGTPISASVTAAELFGCVLESSAGGLKSICVSLLELSPISDPKSSACTRSDRGGARLEPEAVDCVEFGCPGAGELWSAELPCCPHTATDKPKIAKARNREAITNILPPVLRARDQKNRPLRGRSERPVGKVLRGGGESQFMCYIEDGLFCPLVAGVAGWFVSPTVFVINRTSTRRLSARPCLVLFVSTGLSLPNPIT